MRYLQSTPPFSALPDARGRHEKPPPASLLAAAVHAQSEGMLIASRRWTRNGLRIIFANESFCAMTGYTVSELRQGGQALLHDNKKDLAPLHRWQTRLKPGTTLSGEGFLRRKDGAQLYSSWNYCPVSDEQGRVIHIVATYRDLTEKRRLQEALIHSQRLDAVGRLAGGVAHDFNNLLSVINGYCEMMAARREVKNLAAHELEEIHQASQKAANLVRQLLAFSRRQANNPRVVNLDQLVRDNVEILSRLLKPSRSLQLALGAGPANIRVDPSQIEQVLLNLTLNARDALRVGGHVTISTSVRETGPKSDAPQAGGPSRGPYALLTVSDNGAGMDEEVRAHLFEPFFTTKEPGKGTGLGLALVYGVVQQSKGFIRVQSVPQVGSTFEIFLPLVNEPAQPSTSSSSLAPFPTAAGGRERVLVVEEDDVVRKMVIGIFSADGYTVIPARDLEEADAALRKTRKPVDLAIVQISTKPSSEEEKLLRRFHERFPAARILMACSPECAPLPFIPVENQAVLVKPFTLSTLMKAARRLLDSKKHPAR